MKKISLRYSSVRFQWLVIPVILLMLNIAVFVFVAVPLINTGIMAGKQLFNQYTRKNDALNWPSIKQEALREIYLLDSLLRNIDQKNTAAGRTLIDELYVYAENTGIQISRVEAGAPQNGSKMKESSLQIEGYGSYTAIGKMIEKIENSSQSTRIRNMSLTSANNKGDIKLFIDVAVRDY
jgi:Tfp pilus assembly protein PilO